MRVLSVLIALASLWVISPAATANDAWLDTFSDSWKGTLMKDPITDADILAVSVVTSEINERHGVELARVWLMCEEGTVLMRIDWSYKVAGKSKLSADYRFDGKKGRNLAVRYVARDVQETTVAKDIRQFLADAASPGSSNLLVRISSDLGGVAIAKFRTGRGPNMVRKLTAACPDYAP